jgi:Fic family protein
MTEDSKQYQLNADIEVSLNDANEIITRYELEQLRRQDVVADYTVSNYQLEELVLDSEELAKMAYEYSILEGLASNVEVEVMKYFRNTQNKRVTSKEVREHLNRPASTVSRALSSLVEKGQITRVQKGVYEYR